METEMLKTGISQGTMRGGADGQDRVIRFLKERIEDIRVH